MNRNGLHPSSAGGEDGAAASPAAQRLAAATSVAAAATLLPETLTREQRRSRRKRAVRPRSISALRLSRRDLERLGVIDWLPDVQRPLTRADCVNGPRPCPHVCCRYHLYLDVSPRTGTIKLNFPDLEVWEMTASCALDVADDGSAKLEDVGTLLNITRERARQIELEALTKLEALADTQALRQRDE